MFKGHIVGFRKMYKKYFEVQTLIVVCVSVTRS